MSFDEQLERALDVLAERLRDEVSRHVRSAVGELAAEARASQPEVPAAESAAATGLADGVRRITAARTLTAVLEALVDASAREAARAGVLLVRGDRFQGWRSAGFEPTFGKGGLVDLPRTDAGVIGRAVDTGSVAASDDDAAGPAFARLSRGQRRVAVPLLVGGQVVAVLYADSGTQNPEPSALDLEPESTRVEHSDTNREPGALHVETLEILGLHASRSLEALTAMKAAQWLAAQGRTRPERGSREDSDGPDEYVAARRYARLLVSELKLYHEPQVAAGRRDRDLATRLGREIARVHALYEERVPATVRLHTDYVREELIRTLADGDASLIEG